MDLEEFSKSVKAALMHGICPSKQKLLCVVAAYCLLHSASVFDNASAQTAPITSSGLNTQISGPIPAGEQVQYDITGGTRAGTNLFHSFGEFGVPNHTIANFHNNSGLATSNILGRVTGGNISNIFGAIQTADFGSANLFLMNPAGFLFGPNATVNVGGVASFTTADYLRLSDGKKNGYFYADLTGPSLLTASPVAAFGFLGSNPGAITVQGSEFRATGISLVGRNITIESGTSEGKVHRAQLSAPNGTIQLAVAASPGAFDAKTLQSIPNVDGTSFTSFGSINLAPNSTIDVSGTNTVSIKSGQFVLSVIDAALTTSQSTGSPNIAVFNTGSAIKTETSGTERGADVHIVSENIQVDGRSSGIFTDTLGANAGGDITLTAHSVTLRNAGTLAATTSGTETSATGGTITLDAAEVVLNGNAKISAGTSGPGNAGRINIAGTKSISFKDSTINNGVNGRNATGTGGMIQLTSPTIELDNSRIRTATSGLRNAGDIDVAVGRLILTNNSQLQARTTYRGDAGDISLHGRGGMDSPAQSITFKGSLILGDTVGDNSYVEGNAGNIFISTERFALMESSGITTATTASSGSSGNITINATDSVTISQSSLRSNSEDFSLGGAGKITITSPSISVEAGGIVTTSTDYTRNAGDITFKTASLHLNSGGHLSSSSVNKAPPEAPELRPSGNAGTVTIEGTVGRTQSITMTGAGSGIFTETQGDGLGGNITLKANQIQLRSGAKISANSAGAADAGNIDVIATNGLTMQDSSLTTRVEPKADGSNSGGGIIKITTSPNATVHLQDNSVISASVPGKGIGGNISIDPQFVVLQNSRILAQADRGRGGNITITTSVFQPDATSVVKADAERGVNGTVTIQAPYAPAGGKVQPLSNRPLQAAWLLNQRCASVAGGQFSSFTVAGRNSLPTEPGGWLSSPLALAIPLSHDDSMTDGRSQVNPAVLQEGLPLLSIRQIGPPGFLTKTFAVNKFAGCRS